MGNHLLVRSSASSLTFAVPHGLRALLAWPEPPISFYRGGQLRVPPNPSPCKLQPCMQRLTPVWGGPQWGCPGQWGELNPPPCPQSPPIWGSSHPSPRFLSKKATGARPRHCPQYLVGLSITKPPKAPPNPFLEGNPIPQPELTAINPPAEVSGKRCRAAA